MRLSHRYLIHVDGNTWAGRFQFYLLDSRSLVLSNRVFIDWYMWKLKPWIHHVPFELDVSDLEEKLKWAIENDDEAKKIADYGYEYANKHLRDEDSRCYTGLLILEYANLLE